MICTLPENAHAKLQLTVHSIRGFANSDTFEVWICYHMCCVVYALSTQRECFPGLENI